MAEEIENQLTFIKELPEKAYNGYKYGLYKCSCGKESIHRIDLVKCNHSKSCGHSRKKHGITYSPTWKSWQAMKRRCYNKNDDNYKHYGGRGIKVCDRWMYKRGFINFLEDMGERPSLEYTLHRINNDGDYCPENCKWATDEEQANAKSNSRYITFDGITQTMAQWARQLGVKPGLILNRLDNLGWDIEKALTTPPKDSNVYITYNNTTKNITEWGNELGIKPNVLAQRIRKWGVEKAFNTPLKKIPKFIFRGEYYTISELSKKFNIDYQKLYYQLRTLNWSVEEAINGN